jgi:hypothetical protein
MRKILIAVMGLMVVLISATALSPLAAQEVSPTPGDSTSLAPSALKVDSAAVPSSDSLAQGSVDSARAGAEASKPSLRNLFVQEIVRSTTSFEAGPTGLKVSNIPGWMFLLLVIGAVLFGLLTQRSKPESNTAVGAGLLTIVLVIGLLIAGGYWFGRWRVQRDLARTERALVVLQENASEAQAQVLAARDSIRLLRDSLTNVQESVTNASMKLLTSNMVWAIIIGAFILLLPLTWFGTAERLQNRRLRRMHSIPPPPDRWGEGVPSGPERY